MSNMSAKDSENRFLLDMETINTIWMCRIVIFHEFISLYDFYEYKTVSKKIVNTIFQERFHALNTLRSN